MAITAIAADAFPTALLDSLNRAIVFHLPQNMRNETSSRLNRIRAPYNLYVENMKNMKNTYTIDSEKSAL